MNFKILVLFLPLLWLNCCISLDAKATPVSKQYAVNLDMPPEKRWIAVLNDCKTKEILTLNYIFGKVIPKALVPIVNKIGKEVEKYIKEPYASEMKGIAEHLGYPVGEIVISNVLYDITAFCTSIVCQDSKGQIWHGRNMDYAMSDLLRNITINVNFQKANKTLYTATTYCGYVGILTGQKPNAFTISVDERNKGDWWMNALVALLDRKASVMSFLVRNTLEQASGFELAVKQLSETVTIAPVYFIVGGTQGGQGAVITKDRIRARDIWYLDAQHGRWFLVETNYDRWEPPPTSDDRRHPAIKAMNTVGKQNINFKSLFAVLSTPPILRSNNFTVYTTIMSASQPDVYTTWTR